MHDDATPLEDPLSSNQAELIEAYEREYHESAVKLKILLDEFQQLHDTSNNNSNNNSLPTSTPAQRRQNIEKLEKVIVKQFDQASLSIKNIELCCADNSNGTVARQAMDRVKIYKFNVNKMKQQLDSTRLMGSSSSSKKRAELEADLDELDNENDEEIDALLNASRSREQRQRAKEATRMLKKGTNSLSNALEVVHNIEDTGAASMAELGKQRDKIKSAAQKVHHVNEELKDSRRILSSLEWRRVLNRVATVGIVVLLIIVLLLILYLAVIKPIVG